MSWKGVHGISYLQGEGVFDTCVNGSNIGHKSPLVSFTSKKEPHLNTKAGFRSCKIWFHLVQGCVALEVMQRDRQSKTPERGSEAVSLIKQFPGVSRCPQRIGGRKGRIHKVSRSRKNGFPRGVGLFLFPPYKQTTRGLSVTHHFPC